MLESFPVLISLLVCGDELTWILNMVVVKAERVMGLEVAASGGKQVVWWALIGVDSVSGCCKHELLEEMFTQNPSLLGRQFVQGPPAFTQVHPLHKPALLHLQHGIVNVQFV